MYDRRNAYPLPNYLKRYGLSGMTESFTCSHAGFPGDGTRKDPAQGAPPCFVQPPHLWDGKKFPRIQRGNKIVSKPLGNRGTDGEPSMR